MNNNKHIKSLIYLCTFFIAWTAFTIWLNLEHKKEISIISDTHDLALKVTHTSDIIISSYVTGYPEIHEKAIRRYKEQIGQLRNMNERLESLWPKTPGTLVSAIDEAESGFNDLLKNPQSYALHKKFSESNVYFKNMSYHEYSLAHRDMLHKNLPLFLILALILLLGLRYMENINLHWGDRSVSKVRHGYTGVH